MRRHLDADYLRLQIALEAFAYWTLQHAGQEERMLVNDKKAWKPWVTENADTIRGLAAEGFEESLFNRVIGVYRLSSGRVVPSAFMSYDLQLTSEMVEELERRNTVVHQGLMAPDGGDAQRDSRRVAMIRALLVALVARTVDYQGAINGWDRGPAGYLIEPTDWWVVREEDRRVAEQAFVAEGPAKPPRN